MHDYKTLYERESALREDLQSKFNKLTSEHETKTKDFKLKMDSVL